MDCDTLFKNMTATVVRSLGQTVTYQAEGNDAQQVKVIPEDPSTMEEIPEAGMLVVFAKLGDFAVYPERGASLTIGPSSYRVFRVEADQAGGVRLALRRS